MPDEMALPLVADFRVDGLALRVLDDELGDLPEGGDRLGGLLGGSVRLDRVDAAGDESPRRGCPVASILEADRWIGAETFVLLDAGDLVAQNPLLAPHLAHHEVEAVAVAVPARLCRLHSSFPKPSHPQSHIRSHTWTRIVAHTGGRRKTQTRVSHRIHSRLKDGYKWRWTEVWCISWAPRFIEPETSQKDKRLQANSSAEVRYKAEVQRCSIDWSDR